MPGRSTRISASSRTACSASSSRPRAASSRPACSPRDRPAVSCAARLRAYATILGQAARGSDLAAHAIVSGLLDLGLNQVALFPPDVRGGRGNRALRRRLLGREQSSYASRLPPYTRISPPDRSAIWSIRASSSRSWLTITITGVHDATASYSRLRASRSRLLVGSSSSRMSGRRRNSAASATRMVSPPDSRSTRSSRVRFSRPSRSSQARARSSTSQSSPIAAKTSSPVSPASMACSASRAAVMPSRPETLWWVPRVMACGR